MTRIENSKTAWLTVHFTRAPQWDDPEHDVDDPPLTVRARVPNITVRLGRVRLADESAIYKLLAEYPECTTPEMVRKFLTAVQELTASDHFRSDFDVIVQEWITLEDMWAKVTPGHEHHRILAQLRRPTVSLPQPEPVQPSPHP